MKNDSLIHFILGGCRSWQKMQPKSWRIGGKTVGVITLTDGDGAHMGLGITPTASSCFVHIDASFRAGG